jgi:hypothetical protein
MFAGFFNTPLKKFNFEDLQYAIKNKERYILINTLPVDEQICMIVNTVKYDMEEKVINE